MFEEIEKIAFQQGFVVDTTVLFYLQRVGLLELFVDEYGVVIPESVRMESIRKDCDGDSGVVSSLVERGAIEVNGNYTQFPGEEAVFRLAEDKGMVPITDDGAMIGKLVKLARTFTSSPMIPVMLFMKERLSEKEMEEKVKEILDIGFYGEDVKKYMDKVVKLVKGGRGD